MLLLSGAALTAPSKRPEADNALLVKPHDVPHPEMGPFQYAKMLRNNPACHAAREDEGVAPGAARVEGVACDELTRVARRAVEKDTASRGWRARRNDGGCCLQL